MNIEITPPTRNEQGAADVAEYRGLTVPAGRKAHQINLVRRTQQ